MPKGQLYINDVDVYEQYGVSMDNNALSALMTPVARKAWVKNETRTEAGTQYLLSEVPKAKERELTIGLHMFASNEEQFMERYLAFVTILSQSALLKIRTSFQSDVVYRCVYDSCTQFTQFRREYAYINLKVIEINPENRSV